MFRLSVSACNIIAYSVYNSLMFSALIMWTPAKGSNVCFSEPLQNIHVRHSSLQISQLKAVHCFFEMTKSASFLIRKWAIDLILKLTFQRLYDMAPCQITSNSMVIGCKSYNNNSQLIVVVLLFFTKGGIACLCCIFSDF